MKRYFSMFMVSIFMVMLVSSLAFAGQPIAKMLFSNSSTVQGAASYSSAVKVSPSELKSVVVNGVYQGGTFGNFSGTVLLQCGPSSTGPWTTCKDVGGNAVSSTSNGHFNLESMIPYVRASWTRTKHRVSVWLYYFSE